MDDSQIDFMMDCLSCNQVYSSKKDGWELGLSVQYFYEVHPKVDPQVMVFWLSRVFPGMNIVRGVDESSLFLVDQSDPSDHVVLVRLSKVDDKWWVGEV